MIFQPERTAIIGATGPTGIHLARQLRERGWAVRAVSRRREHLEQAFAGAGVEIVVADALDPEATRRATEGCDLLVDAIGLPPEHMADHPRTARVVTDAARAAGARCLQVSSYWSYLPHRGEVVDESHPRRGGHPWFRFRREAEDIVTAAGGAVVHLPDFFGPEVHTATVQLALQDAAAGRPMNWIGGADVPREAAYVPDMMAVVARLLEHDEAYGEHWALPGSGPLTARELARLAGEHLGRRVKVRAAPGWLLYLLGTVNAELRTMRPMISPYTRPVRYGTTKLRRLLGEVPTTPFGVAVPATFDWIATHQSG